MLGLETFLPVKKLLVSEEMLYAPDVMPDLPQLCL